MPPQTDSTTRSYAPHLGGAGSIASLDPSHVQQTKSEIRKLAAEIAELAHSKIAPEAFWDGFLPRLTVAMGATGAAIWCLDADAQDQDAAPKPTGPQSDAGISESNGDSNGETHSPVAPFVLTAHHQLPSELRATEPESVVNFDSGTSAKAGAPLATRASSKPTPQHAEVLQCVAAEGQPILVPPSTVRLDATRPVNPLEESLIIVPVRREDQVEYLLEVVLGASGGPAAQRGYLRFVAQMADLMADFLRRSRLRRLEHEATRQDIQHQWLLRCAAAGDPQQRLAIAADGLNDILTCQQTILVKSTSKRARVVAISGAPRIDNRSEVVEKVLKLHRAISTRYRSPEDEPVELTLGKSDEDPPKSAEQYSIDAVCKLLNATLVTRRSLVPTKQSVATEDTGHPHESYSAYCFFDLTRDRASCETEVCDEIAANRSIFEAFAGLIQQPTAGLPWWSAVLPQKQLQTSRRSIALKTIAVVALLACTIIPVPQRIRVTGVLHPVERAHYYAPERSRVEKLFVQEGDAVKAGDVLLELVSDQLSEEIDVLDGELSKTQSWQDSLNSNSGTGFEYTQAQIEIHKLETLRRVHMNQLEQLRIRARTDGQVATWDLQNSLMHRQVESDTLLLTTFNPEGDWYIDLKIPDRRVGLVDQTLSKEHAAQVAFSLTSQPDQSYSATLTDVSSQSFADSATTSAASSPARSVQARAMITSDNLRIRRDGIVVRATIECGQVPAIWLLVRDAYWEISSRLSLLW